MIPEHLSFGGGVSQTFLNPYVAAVVLLAGLFICFATRQKAIVAFLSTAILIPMDQILLIGSFHFPVVRILVIFGAVRILWARIFSKTEIFTGGVNGIDIAMIVLTLFRALAGILVWQVWGAVVFQLGEIYTIFGVYFLARFLIRDTDDVRCVVRTLACIVAVVAVIMICEHALLRNPIYAILGGARAGEYGEALEIRSGRVRATGVFAHPILAGTFGGFCLPLFVGLWWKGEKKDRKYAALGAVTALVLPFAANSSTALMTCIAAFGGLFMWPVRKLMRPIRWGIVLCLIGLHMVMNGPVWALINHIDVAGGSDSSHRFELVNQCILHFWSWILIGTKDYPNWGWDMFDLSDQYVLTAETGGLIALVSFIAILALSFKYLGLARKAVENNRKEELFVWAFGASIFANAVGFFGISYFDQTTYAWYALLAMVSVITLSARQARSSVVLADANLPLAVPFPAASGNMGARGIGAKGTIRGIDSFSQKT